jgi:alpha-L-fucosidase 2
MTRPRHPDHSGPEIHSDPANHRPAANGGVISRRGMLRGATAAGLAAVLPWGLPEFTAPAAAAAEAPRPTAAPVSDGKAVTLWYGTPGTESLIMNEGLPVGNGRLGAMCTGDPASEAIYWSEATLWTGNENFSLGSDGQFSYETENFGTWGQLARAYLTVPAHTINAVTGYRRELDLSNGLVSVSYMYNGVRYQREVFASRPDDVIVIRLTAGDGGSWTGSLALDATRGETVVTDASHTVVSFAAALDNGLRYAALITATGNGGALSAANSAVAFDGCREVTLILSGGTNYVSNPSSGFKNAAADPLAIAQARAAAAASVAPPVLLGTHLADYQSLEQRLSVNLGQSTEAQRAMSTDARLAALASSGTPDPELQAAYLMFGRYLMISGSRTSLPISLQGLWIDNNTPAWMSDYHTDINLEMVYWLPDRTGLSQSFDAFADYCVTQFPLWEKSTLELFQSADNGFRNTSGKVAGWTIAISINPYGGDGWWWHVAGSAWLCNSLFDHYQYTLDQEYLAKIYPLIKGACQFWEARLITTTITDPATGAPRTVLVDDHDWSPEQGPTDAIGITYAQEQAWQLFTNFQQAATTLGKDAEYAKTIAGLQSQLYLPEVSPTTGWLEEWMTPDNLGDPQHRHLSPLFGLFPGDRINVQDSPESLLTGVRNLLTARGLQSYGWGEAWRALCWARLKEPETCYQLLLNVLSPSVDNSNGSAINMFDMYQLSDTSSVFQIDANMGAPSAMVEMLVQSRPGRVEVLPALPAAWAASGHLHGVGARPGMTVDVDWANGTATTIRLSGRPGTTTTVVAGSWSDHVTIPGNGTVTVHPA